MTPRVELENKVGIVNQATMDYNITLQGRLRCNKGNIMYNFLRCVKLLWVYIYIYIFFNRTDHRVNKVGTVGPIAEANMRDFERKKNKNRVKQEHMETAAN